MRLLALMLLSVGWLAACGGASQAPLCEGGAPAAAEVTGYRLGPGDRILVTVFRQPDMSGEFALDGEGSLALPLVGEFAAGGLTARELEDQIEARLRAEEFLVNPQVGVQQLTYRSIYVLGEVAQPGSYEYRDGINLINAVALAGGYTYRADSADVTIERGGCSFPGLPATSVQPGDIITVKERFF